MASRGSSDGPVGDAGSGGPWASWTQFRALDIRRLGPCEVEYGSRWQGPRLDLPWRIVWLEGTGEVVAVQWSASDEGGDAGPVRLLGVVTDRALLDETLKDWWHMCGHLGSLDWVVTRLAGRGLAA